MRITAQCPRCGTTHVPLEELTVVVAADGETAWCTWGCWYCAHHVTLGCRMTMARALSGMGVRLWTVPAEVSERADAVHALSVDDVLDAVLDMRGWLPCPCRA